MVGVNAWSGKRKRAGGWTDPRIDIRIEVVLLDGQAGETMDRSTDMDRQIGGRVKDKEADEWTDPQTRTGGLMDR